MIILIQLLLELLKTEMLYKLGIFLFGTLNRHTALNTSATMIYPVK